MDKSISSLNKYRQQFEHISTQTFEKILEDYNVAFKYAKIGLQKTGTQNPSLEDIEKHTQIIRSVAKLILSERENKA
jgi:hypothetical protein